MPVPPPPPVRKAGKRDIVEVLRTGRNDPSLRIGKRSDEMNKRNTKNDRHRVTDLTNNNLAHAGLYILPCCFLLRRCSESIFSQNQNKRERLLDLERMTGKRP
uniref:Uncharacterized protein n=1 Tax=Salix viminalis TaxID=40686 RepID=A0A6N2N3D2_SALVM